MKRGAVFVVAVALSLLLLQAQQPGSADAGVGPSLSVGCTLLNNPLFDGFYSNNGTSSVAFTAGERIVVRAAQPTQGSPTDFRLAVGGTVVGPTAIPGELTFVIPTSGDYTTYWESLPPGATRATWTVSCGLPASTPTPTPVRRDGTISKTVSPSSGIRVGDTVTFTITINLPTAHDNVVVQDIFAGAGKAPDTAFVGPATLSGSPTAPSNPSPVPVLTKNFDNWVQYTFTLGDLAAGTYTLTYGWKISPKLGCYSQANNTAYLDYAGVSGHVDTSRIAFQIRGC